MIAFAELFEVFLRQTVASTLVFAVMGLVLAVRRSSAATRHRLILAAFVCTLLSPIAIAVAPSWRILPAGWASELGLAPLDAMAVELPDASRAPLALPPHDGFPAQSLSGWSHLAALFLIAWIVASVILLSRLALALLCQRRARCSSVQLDAPTSRALTQSARALGFTAVPSCALAPVRIPLTYGVRSAIVLLPLESTLWTSGRMRMVLLHELAHVLRRDALWRVVAQLTVALNPLQPLAWLSVGRLRDEQEQAADDLVLEHGAPPTDYAQDLLELACLDATDQDLALAAHATNSRGLEKRIRRILNPRAPRSAAAIKAPLGACIAFALLASSADPAGPRPAFWRPSNLVFDDEGRVCGVVRGGPQNPVCWLTEQGTIATAGRVRFVAGERIVLGPNAYLLLEVPRGDSFDRVEARADAAGKIAYMRTRKGQPVEPAGAAAWLNQNLPQTLETTPLEHDGQRLQGAL